MRWPLDRRQSFVAIGIDSSAALGTIALVECDRLRPISTVRGPRSGRSHSCSGRREPRYRVGDLAIPLGQPRDRVSARGSYKTESDREDGAR
jgi:hypothetical protein